MNKTTKDGMSPPMKQPKKRVKKRKCTDCKDIFVLCSKHFHPVSTKCFGGFTYRCRSCSTIHDGERWSEKYAKHKDKYLYRSKDWALKNPEKVRAAQKARYAVKMGALKKSPCIVCGNPKSQGHHEDYNKPLEVVWLCLSHHRQRHVTLSKKPPKKKTK